MWWQLTKVINSFPRSKQRPLPLNSVCQLTMRSGVNFSVVKIGIINFTFLDKINDCSESFHEIMADSFCKSQNENSTADVYLVKSCIVDWWKIGFKKYPGLLWLKISFY